MRAINNRFTQIINGNRQFSIPIFQRDYCWTRKHCADMWKAVHAASDGRKDGGHFMGSVVYVPTGEVSATFQNWLIVDGQQRLTTLTLLLTALRDCIITSSWSGGNDSPSSEKIDAYYLKNLQETGERQYKLVLRRADRMTLQALIDGKGRTDNIGTSDIGGDVSKLVVDAYKFFREKLDAPNCDFDRVYRGIGRLDVVDVLLHPDTDNPQLIFESMNSTGADLSQSDLVRNYLLMGIRKSDQDQLYDKYWSEIESNFRKSPNAFDSFLRDYIALETEATVQAKADRIYDAFKEFWQPDGNISLDALLKDMTRVARTYASFLGTAAMQRPWLIEAMKNMRSLSTTQGLVIMRLYDYHEKELLTQDEFVQAIELIESYLLRRAVLGSQSRGYWSVFARLAREMHNSQETPFRSLQVAFARLGDNYRFPTDDEFTRALREHDLYNLQACKHILNRLENANQKEKSPVHEYSIEHVMPQGINASPAWQGMLGDDWQRVHSTWLHRLGNLTLTAYNSTYSNRSFKEKKEIEGGFNQSAVRLNQYIRNQTHWTETEIQKREELLIRQALKIWQYNNVDEADIQAAYIRELRERAAERNVDDLEMNGDIRILLDAILERVRELGEVIQIVEHKSVCCYGPEFFVELLPMVSYIRVLLPLDFAEVEEPNTVSVEDTSSWKFVPNRQHGDCNLLADLTHEEEVSSIMPIIRQAFDR